MIVRGAVGCSGYRVPGGAVAVDETCGGKSFDNFFHNSSVLECCWYDLASQCSRRAEVVHFHKL